MSLFSSRGFKVGHDGPHELLVSLDVHPMAGVGEPDELGVGEDGPENKNK